MGAVLADVSGHTQALVTELRRATRRSMRLLVLAGTELPIAVLPGIGVIGVAYVGAFYPPRPTRSASPSRCGSSSPDMAEQVTAVALAAVIVFEVVGPVPARRAFQRAGEMQALA